MCLLISVAYYCDVENLLSSHYCQDKCAEKITIRVESKKKIVAGQVRFIDKECSKCFVCSCLG
jgi:hypothetical protein